MLYLSSCLCIPECPVSLVSPHAIITRYDNLYAAQKSAGNTFFMNNTVHDGLKALSKSQKDGVEKVVRFHKSIVYPSMVH